MGSGAFEIGIAETPLRLSSLKPHQVIHTVGETMKLAPSATPQSSPTNLVSSWRRLGNHMGASARTTSRVKATKNAAKQSIRQ